MNYNCMSTEGLIIPFLKGEESVFSKYDLSKKEKANDLYLNSLIANHLGEYSDKWFVEYSVLATTIDPSRTSDSKGKLRCLSFIQDTEDGSFKKAIERYVSPIIDVLKTVADDKNWWFHNPETFLAPFQINPYLSFTSNAIKCEDGIVQKIKDNANAKEYNKYERVEDDGDNKNNGDKKPFYVSSMEYPRTFESILDYSKILYEGFNKDPQTRDEKLIEHYHLGVEQARLYYDKFVAKAGETYCYLTFPIVASHARFVTPEIYKKTFGSDILQERYQGIGHCFIYFRINEPQLLNDEVRLDTLKDKIKELFLEINSTLHNFAFNYTFNIGLLLQERTREEAIKAAKAAIMSRNMSHNLGSHFISNTKNYFDALIDRTQNNAPVYRGVKFALQYIQERMDFIATVTSDDKYPFGVVNAKAQIFDELTPDDLGARHQKQSLNFLMDYLVLSEKISKRSYDLAGTTSLLSKGTHVLKLLMGYEKEDGTVEFWNSEKADDISKRDNLVNINFAIPGGILGRHAVFSIIENVIRNAAKHGQDKIGDEFVIRLLCTKDNHLVIYDNKCDQQIRKTVESLTERMHNLRMLNPDNSLNQDNKGLKEILICAAWLQNTSISDVLQNKNFDDYVRIMAVNNEGKELPSSAPDGYLAYSIHLDRFEKSVYLNCTPSIDSIKSIKADIICADKDYQVEGTNTSLSKMVPRFLIIPSEEYKQIVDAHQEAELLRRVVERNCKITAQNVQMVCSSDEKRHIINGNEGPIVAFENYVEKSADDFLFKGHAGKSKWSKFESLFLTHGFETKYVDAISGGDFTHTLVQPSFVGDLYNLYKIFESVKTRFVIIDERIFEQYRSKKPSKQRHEMLDTLAKCGFPSEDVVNTAFLEEVVDKAFLPTILCDSINKEVPKDNRQQLLDFVSDKQRFLSFCKKDIEQHYLERKNIHVLSFDSMENGTYELKDLSYNCYGHFEMDNGKVSFCANNACHYFTDAENAPITFLSIHLGLIDKVKGRMNGVFDESEIVETLKEYFGDNIFVSIHSGRGGYDVRDALKKYVFQSYSAIENPLHNSKFLLAQQFYNLSYHG